MKHDSELKNTQHLLHTSQETVNETSFSHGNSYSAKWTSSWSFSCKTKISEWFTTPQRQIYNFGKATYFHLKYEGWNFNSHKGLSPCDFDLIPKMKEPLRDIRFRTVPKILQAVDHSIRTINTTGAAKGILRLSHCWQQVVHNAGDYTEGQ